MASGHGEAHEPIDILRKTVIVVLLVAAILLLHRYAIPSEEFDPRGLLALGFVVLAAYTIGELAEVIRLPHITGYLLAGLVLGPSTAHLVHDALADPSWMPTWLADRSWGLHLPPPLDEGILNQRVIDQLKLLDTLALALIALTAGGELKLDQLRKGFRQIVGVLTGQAITIGVGVIVFLVVVVQLLPGSLPALADLQLTPLVALGAVLAAISFATSPAATIAVINSTSASGPMTRTVLSAVVLKDALVVIAYSAAMSVAVGLLGVSTGGGFLQSLGHIATSIVVGVALGGAVHLYLRFVGVELLLFLIGTIYTTTFVVEQLHGEAALTFIVAGLVVGNFSDRGETLIHEVERLSLPVYVVFFTLAGAKLHLEELWVMLIPAGGLVAVRVLALVGGVRLGAVLSNADSGTVRFGWMGFVSQAGLAILLATDIQTTLGPELGGAMFSLILGGVALNEIGGPVLLQWGLGLAGETGGGDDGEPGHVEPGDDEPAGADEEPGPAPWPAPEDDDPWTEVRPTGSDELDAALRELSTDLQHLARDRTWVPLTDLRRDAESWIRQLRREFLRLHRRALVTVQTAEHIEDTAASLRNDVGDLGERWRDLVLALQARARREERWSPMELVQVIDDHVASLPEVVTAPVAEESIAPHPDDGWVLAARRSLLRTGVRLGTAEREVNLRDIARYHLSGEVPARLEGLAALLVNAELHLAARTTALFAMLADGWERAARAADGDATRGEVVELLLEVRDQADTEFQLAVDELEHVARDGQQRANRVLAHAMQRVEHDARVVGTLDLPHWRRRFGRVFQERNRGLQLLTTGLAEARETAAARHAQLALELELVGLEGRVREAVHEHGEQLGRRVRGRGPTQLERVDSAVESWLEATGATLASPPSAGELATALRESTEPLVRSIRGARDNTDALRAQLEGQAWVQPLLEALLDQTQELTRFCEVPVGRPVVGEWALPSAVPTSEIPFQEAVVAFIETRVTRDLIDLTADLAEQVAAMAEMLDEVERVVAFNVELAMAELDVLETTASVPDATMELVRAMVIGAVGRTRIRLERLAEQARRRADGAEQRVHDAVIGEFDALHALILDGDVAELRATYLREGQLPARLVRRAGEWTGWLPEARASLGAAARRALGEDRLRSLRAVLGLPTPQVREDQRAAFAPPAPAVEVPVVYRRLFSDQALEAGDLLSGRQEELRRTRAVLSDRSSRLRSVALVGIDEQSAHALVSSALRGLGLEGPHVLQAGEDGADPTLEEVDAWLAAAAERTDHVMWVADASRWFRREPGGFEPLQRLVSAIVADEGRNAWVLTADTALWQFCATTTGLEDAMGAVVELHPLSVAELEQAILARHAMSGYEVRFRGDEDIGWQLQHVLLRASNRERRRQEAWFRTLHAASAGMLQDALRLWMASIVDVDDDSGVLEVGTVPRPPVQRLQELPEDQLLTLLQACWQGWTTPAQHAALFRGDPGGSEAHLAHLEQVGLLIRTDTRYRVAPHLRGTLHRVLQRRGWS